MTNVRTIDGAVPAMKKGGGKVTNKRGTMRAMGSRFGEPATHIIIGERLRQYYKDILQQPAPERFTNLLTELEGKLASERSR